MHPMSPALAEMVARMTVRERLSATPPVDPTELERRIYRALGEVHRTRPRIVAFAPEVALKRALDLLHGGRVRGGGRISRDHRSPAR